MNEAVNKHLDATGLLCPEPVMLLHRAIREVGAGELIEVSATDPSTQRDIAQFCHFLGHELVGQEERGQTYVFWVRKKV